MSVIRQRQKNLLMAWLLGVLMTGGIITLIITFYQLDIKSIISKKEETVKIEEVKKEEIFVAIKEIKKGSIIQKSDIGVIEYEEEIIPKLVVLNKNEIIGKKALGNISIKTPITKNMVFEDGDIDKDIREQEFQMIYLPSKLSAGEYVDVRINFPTGQDYIIMSKKKVEDLSKTDIESKVWFHLNEDEILTMSSAIIDAFLNEGSKIYLLTYVAPEIQEKAVPNYPVSDKVLKLMKDNPNLVLEAERELILRKRKDLESSLALMEEEDKTLVSQGEINPLEDELIVDENIDTNTTEEEITDTEDMENSNSSFGY